jgi:hypothetical protein
MKNNIEYNEVAKAKISDTRNIIISECNKGGYTIAQQLEITEGKGKTTTVFMKGALHIDDIEGLENLKHAINETIDLEKK